MVVALIISFFSGGVFCVLDWHGMIKVNWFYLYEIYSYYLNLCVDVLRINNVSNATKKKTQKQFEEEGLSKNEKK